MPRIRNKAKAPPMSTTLQSAYENGPLHPGPIGGVPISAVGQTITLPPPQSITLTLPEPETAGDIIFTAGKESSAAGMGNGRAGRIIWAIPNGPSIIMHGTEHEHSFTVEQDNKVLFSLPRDLTGGKYSLENIVREIVRHEIRLATVASIKEVVKQELGAVEGYGKAAAQVATDLRDMGFDGQK